jgi:hypothetical protein
VADILASLCNRRPGEPALVRVDTLTGETAPLSLRTQGLGR